MSWRAPVAAARLSLIALIENPRAIHRILSHRRLSIDVPAPGPARSPPLLVESEDPTYDDDVVVP